jgi:flagellar FliJ protein
MARFVFKLEGVLRQRTNVERQRQRELADWQAKLAGLETELRTLGANVQATEQDLRTNRLIGKLDLMYLAGHRRYVMSMQRKGMAIAEQMAGVQTRAQEARRNLIEAAKQKKIVEKLRERQFSRWKADADRSELAAMDEAGMQLAYQQTAAEMALGELSNGETEASLS